MITSDDVVSTIKRTGRMLVRVCAVTVTALGILALSASQAHAATAAWKLLSGTAPTHLAPYTSEHQSVSVLASNGGLLTAGSFTLTFDGDTTAPIAASVAAFAVAQDIESALNALPSVSTGGGSVSVTVTVDIYDRMAYVVSFDGGPLASADVPTLSGAVAGGGTVTASPAGSGLIVVSATNVGSAATDTSTIVVEAELPDGITGLPSPECAVSGQEVTCTRTGTPVRGPGQTVLPIVVPVVVGPGAPPQSMAAVTIHGAGARPASLSVPIEVSAQPVAPGVQTMWAAAFDEDGNPFTQAGGHPASAGAAFLVNTALTITGDIIPVEDARDLNIDPPVGFVGNPLVVDRCPDSLPQSICETNPFALGRAQAIYSSLKGFTPLYAEADAVMANKTPPLGTAARIFFRVGTAQATAVASLRPEDFGVRLTAPTIPTSLRVYGATSMLYGSPPAAAGKAFLTNPTECTGQSLPTFMTLSSWQHPGLFSDPISDLSPATTGCSAVPFDPAVNVVPTSLVADSAGGLEFDVEVPQEGLLDAGQIAQSHLDDVTVDLPAGMAVNPSGATGLKGCSDAQMARGTKTAPDCPDGSKLGTVQVTSPLVDHPIGGTMYLGVPKSTDPLSGQMLRLWVVARDDQTGTMVKLPGSATADPASGKLTARFENNPRVPFDHLSVKLRGGSKGLLAMSQDCGPKSIGTSLSPWSGNAPVDRSSQFDVSAGCSLGFAPSLAAGMSSRKARGSGIFSFRFSRDDGEQWIDGLTARLPGGLLASVKDVALCSDVQAAAGACPAPSRVGSVDATAGSGDPFVLERKGDAFLTEGYQGCPYGLLVSVPVVAGPFDASSPETDLGSIDVRQAVCVDRSTAEVSAVSDPLPTIWHGVPLRVRSVTVNVDRSGFMLNPSGCSQKQVGASFDSNRGATAGASTPFQASGCAALAFKPKLALRLTGRKQVRTGKHPGVKATVTQRGVSEAGIEKTVVRLPKSLALDPDNARALCEFEDGTKPDLENHCPKGSIVGRARAKTPLLKDDLAGNVYFVKNVRIDKKTGNEIRTLPMIIVALRGEIAVNLKGESSTTKAGRLVNTFASVPDAPISRFNLNIKGGRNGILAVTRTRRATINLCAGRHIAEADIDGHNGKRHDRNIRMKTPCSKRQTKAAKRAAKRASRRR